MCLRLCVEDLLQGPRRQNGKHKHSLSLCDVFQVLRSSISLKIITPEWQRSITTAPSGNCPQMGTQREGGNICERLGLPFLPLLLSFLLGLFFFFIDLCFVDDDDPHPLADEAAVCYQWNTPPSTLTYDINKGAF